MCEEAATGASSQSSPSSPIFNVYLDYLCGLKLLNGDEHLSCLAGGSGKTSNNLLKHVQLLLKLFVFFKSLYNTFNT